MNEKEIFKVTSGDDNKQKKLMLYKFFFFNYMTSVTLSDIIASQSMEPEFFQRLFKTLSLMLETLKDKQLNRTIDLLFSKPSDSSFNEEESTTASIIRLALFNLEILTRLKGPESGNLTEGLLDVLVVNLMDHEENGDIIEPIYQILDSFLGGSEEAIKVVDQSKNLLQIGIKHTAVYQCEWSYKFLRNMVTQSEKYKNKGEIETVRDIDF